MGFGIVLRWQKNVEDALEGKTKIARMIQGGDNFLQVLQRKKTQE